MSSLCRVLVLASVGLALALAGCAGLDDDRVERLFEQGGERAHPDAPSLESAEGNLTLHFVDVGQGDGIVVHFPDATVVYDTGRWHGDSETAVRDHLRAEDADPDVLVVSHPDADHAGGCDVVLEAFAIEAVYHPGIAKDTRTWRDCERAMRAEGVPVRTDADLSRGEQLAWSSHARVELLHVDGDAGDANAGSIVLGLTYGSVTFALAGDATCETEERILERGLVGDLDVVQVAHHGSSTSTCDPWLRSTDPAVGVVSVGENTYGHPHSEVLDRLEAHGVDVYRTDQHGTVTIATDGTAWDVRTARDSAADGETGDEETGEPGAPVVVGDVRYDPPGDDNENLDGEWVEIVNRGNETVDVGGWTLADEASHAYEFPPGFALEAGANVTVHTGSGGDGDGRLYWNRSQAVWNNGGDTAFLHDADDSTVDAKSW